MLRIYPEFRVILFIA